MRTILLGSLDKLIYNLRCVMFISLCIDLSFSIFNANSANLDCVGIAIKGH